MRRIKSHCNRREAYGGYHSKRWIVDRATLKQARADDLHYVDDPEHLDCLSIFFTSGESHTPGREIQTLSPSSYIETRKEA